MKLQDYEGFNIYSLSLRWILSSIVLEGRIWCDWKEIIFVTLFDGNNSKKNCLKIYLNFSTNVSNEPILSESEAQQSLVHTRQSIQL